MPVFDDMAAANGRLNLSTTDGALLLLGAGISTRLVPTYETRVITAVKFPSQFCE